jgi:hypothetical protein
VCVRSVTIDAKEYSNIPFFINNSTVKNIVRNNLQNNNNIDEGCKHNDKSSVLIEFVPNGLSIYELLKDPIFQNRPAYFNLEVYNILFQLYFTLSGLREIYTHYDLHLDNVMFIKIPNNEKMKIDYNINNIIYTIYTSFVPVILDYGRSFVDCLKIDNILNSRIFAEIACNNSSCNIYKQPKCNTIESGLVIEKNENDIFSKQENFYHINLRNKNESIDLRYLHKLMTLISNETPIKKLYKEYFNKETNWVIKDMYGKVKTDEIGTPIITYGVRENLLDNLDTEKGAAIASQPRVAEFIKNPMDLRVPEGAKTMQPNISQVTADVYSGLFPGDSIGTTIAQSQQAAPPMMKKGGFVNAKTH